MAFFTDELKIYQKNLESLLSKDSSEGFRKEVEHFQNQFLIQNDQLDDLHHHITMHEEWLSKYAKEHPAAFEELFADHAKINENVKSFKKIYNELKEEFKSFAADYYHH